MMQVSQLTIGYGGFPLVKNIFFTLNACEALVITGQNGIGKSTLLATLSALLPPLSGSIQNSFKGITFLSMSMPFHPLLTVQENLMYCSIIGKGRPENILQGLTYFKMSALKDEPISHLSAGQKQRLHLACLFVMKAPLWILDEPTRSLDEDGVALYKNLLEDHLNQGGAAIIAQSEPCWIKKQLNLNEF